MIADKKKYRIILDEFPLIMRLLNRAISFVAILFIAFNVNSQTVKISIYNDMQVKTVMFTPTSGEYEIFANNTSLIRILKNEIIQLYFSDGKIGVKSLSKFYGLFSKVDIKKLSKINSFRIKPVVPSLEARNYEGWLSISIRSNCLLLINNVNIESYIAGVVMAEGGPKSPLEYYKSQALLCRTYAIGHKYRHKSVGFELCDGVHCQVYKGMNENIADIEIACEETKALIIVDKTGKIITAAYHSNCAGETENSEDVWSNSVTYLKSIKEDYCKKSPHAKWETTIKLKDWKVYLKKNGFKGIDSLSLNDFELIQRERHRYYSLNGDSMLLTDIRKDWNFKSTMFSIIPVDDELFIRGLGYGHGVGLCQEGAMEMARQGFNYKQIIKHYYKNVEIVKF